MVDDDLILERTPTGQRAAVDEIALGDLELRLLRLVNGFTPLGDLVGRLDTRIDWRIVAHGLLDQGYVAESEALDERLAVRPAAVPAGDA